MLYSDYEIYGEFCQEVFKDDVIFFGKLNSKDVLVRFENLKQQKEIVKVLNKMHIGVKVVDISLSGYFVLNIDNSDGGTIFRNFDGSLGFIEDYSKEDRENKTLSTREFIRKLAMVEKIKKQADKNVKNYLTNLL